MSGKRSFALVHSPVVGPTTWRWVADILTAQGFRVVVPVVPATVTSRGWEAFVDTVCAQIDPNEAVVLVGHSGAGPLLPQIAARLATPPAALIFVDAGLALESGEAELLPPDALAQLRAIARDGLLPVWADWFGPHMIEGLGPDDEKRALVRADLPVIPVSFFEAHVPMPPQWWAMRRCGYVLLSDTYAGEAAEAARRGWVVKRLPGGHLDIVTKPMAVTNAVLSTPVQEP
jgi:hypothetical protein